MTLSELNIYIHLQALTMSDKPAIGEQMAGDRLKSDKNETKDASDVAGREHKGLAGAGLLGKVSDAAEKVMPGDKTGSAAKSEGWMNDPK